MYKAVWSAPVIIAGLFARVPSIFRGVVAAHDNEQAMMKICIKTDIFFIGRFFNHREHREITERTEKNLYGFKY